MKGFAMPNKHYHIALISGDGIGKEVIPDKMPRYA
jgi:isocitrate/isopropylmalate dehydrogenase